MPFLKGTKASSKSSPPTWDAAHVSEQLTGKVIRNGTDVQQIVSFVGQARLPQKLLVRADLLVAPGRLESTSLQLEYLPSGDLCRGRVTNVGGTSFSGPGPTASPGTGSRRSWAVNARSCAAGTVLTYPKPMIPG